MAQSATMGALKKIVDEIRTKGHYGKCQKNSREYADWCEWIESIKERLLALRVALSPATKDAVKEISFNWDDWISVSAAIERIHALSYLIEDDLQEITQDNKAKVFKTFETTMHSYKKKRSIGNGGAGNVFLVERDDGDSFALKVLNKQSSTDNKKIKRFLREIAFCEQSTDLPLIEIVDQGFIQEVDLKRPFYVMPLYKDSLRNLMDSSEVDRESILNMLLSLIASLEGFYDDGHVHRDIKPENILFQEESNKLVLADFGVAHINEDLPELTLQTAPAERLANFKYAAPEQRVVGGEIDHRTDQYAFGLMINELFTETIPQGSGYAKIASIEERFSYLDPVVERMIAQNRNDRYESLSVLIADIVARKKIKGIEDEALKFNSQAIEPFEISLVGKEWVEPDLVFKLNVTPSREWEQCFKSYTGTTSFCTDGFELDPKRFTITGDKILVPKTRGDKNHLTDTCNAMPEYIRRANEVLKRRIEKEAQEAHDAMVQARINEIEKRESSADINRFLAAL